MPLFPVEIWIQIFDDLSKRDKLVLASTNSVFHHIAQVSLYRNVNILNRPTFIRFTRSVATRPELGALVHRLTLDYVRVRHYNDGELSCFATQPLLCQLSPSLRNLQTLALRGFLIDPAFFDEVASYWPRLSTVEFQMCKVIEADIITGKLSASSIMEMTIYDPLSSAGWDVVAHPTLRALTIYHNDAECANDILMRLVARHDGFPLLTQLSLLGSFTVDITPLLVSAPKLRRLEISLPMPDQNLPTSSLSLLEYFSGPAECVGLFIHGRPVRGAELYLWSNTAQDVLSGLHASAVPVTQLTLRGLLLKTSPLILQHAPRSVHTLTVSLGDANSVLSWIPALSLLPSLRVFVAITRHRMFAFRERQLLNALLEAYPGIQEAGFNNSRWRVTRDGEWKCQYAERYD